MNEQVDRVADTARRRWRGSMVRWGLMWSSLAMAATCGCASVGSASTGPGGGRDAVADSARWHLTARPSLKRHDCSGLVQSILARAGIPAQGNSRTFWQDAVRESRVVERPSPGDLAFFDRTYDANGNRRVDDLLTHIAVVVEVTARGLVRMVHLGSRQVKELRLSLEQPGVRKEGGVVLNDYLRAPGYGPSDGPRLAGQLLRGFARPPRR